MNIENIFQKFCIFCLSFLILTGFTLAQKPGSTTPRQEKLLNGLKVLMWNDPSTDKVTVKVRVHSGSAFDPQDREGVIKLLSDSIFPNVAAKEFFADELGGSLEVISNYDYIQINALSRTDQFLTMLETLAAAISNPTIDKETTAALKVSLTAKTKELEKDPAYVADRAVSRRLLGTFPYGRPQMGTADSIQKIDFADLRFAKDRLFTADNATITISGNIDGNLAFRAIRRYFGSWLKSDKKIPSTFRQPDEPDTKGLELNVPGTGNSEVRFALRGLARNDSGFAASQILTRILLERLRASYGKSGRKVYASHDPHVLPGSLILGYESEVRAILPLPMSHQAPASAPAHIHANPIYNMFSISDEEFVQAKTAIQTEVNARELSNWWLDVDTFKTSAVSNEMQAFQNTTAADVRRVAERLSKNPVAVVFVQQTGDVSQTSRK